MLCRRLFAGDPFPGEGCADALSASHNRRPSSGPGIGDVAAVLDRLGRRRFGLASAGFGFAVEAATVLGAGLMFPA